jgi:hypothetical protein
VRFAVDDGQCPQFDDSSIFLPPRSIYRSIRQIQLIWRARSIDSPIEIEGAEIAVRSLKAAKIRERRRRDSAREDDNDSNGSDPFARENQ